MPELRHLRVFVAVAEERNFTRAAERLSLSQQGVSKAVTQLEQELAVVLLERSTHDVSPTQAGLALLAGARASLRAADDAFRAAREIGAGRRGSAQVGITPAVGPRVREELAQALRDDAEEVFVSLRELRPAQLAEALADRSVDVVLTRTDEGHAGVQSRELSPTPASIFLPTDHRLADEPIVPLTDLDGERLMTWSSAGSAYTDLLVEFLRAAGAAVQPIQASVTGGAEPPLLNEIGAVALLPEGWPTGAATVERPTSPEISLPLFLHWRSGVQSPWAQRIEQRFNRDVLGEGAGA